MKARLLSCSMVVTCAQTQGERGRGLPTFGGEWSRAVRLEAERLEGGASKQQREPVSCVSAKLPAVARTRQHSPSVTSQQE